MKPPQINQVAIWLPMKSQELDVRTFDSYQYMDKGIIQTASSLKPVVRYAKNYIKDNWKFSLCLISLERDTAKMEAFLDDVATKVKVGEGMEKFTKTEFIYHA